MGSRFEASRTPERQKRTVNGETVHSESRFQTTLRVFHWHRNQRHILNSSEKRYSWDTISGASEWLAFDISEINCLQLNLIVSSALLHKAKTFSLCFLRDHRIQKKCLNTTTSKFTGMERTLMVGCFHPSQTHPRWKLLGWKWGWVWAKALGSMASSLAETPIVEMK